MLIKLFSNLLRGINYMLNLNLKHSVFVASFVGAMIIFFSTMMSDVTAAAATGDAASKSIAKRLAAPALDKCGMISQFSDSKINSPLSPAASLCINGALAAADPDFNRPLASSTGTGVGTGVVGGCSLSGTATAANYDNISFNLTGCAAFPTEVTITVCGPAGCQHVGNVDTMLVLYRNVAAGDPLTANGGLPAVFNPASPCTNARGGQDDLGTTVGTPNNPGGSTCNQVVGANCVAPCTSPSNAGGLSGMRRQLGNGRFTIVIAGFGNATVGSYNLYIDAPAAGCNVALTSSAANVTLSGRILDSDGRAIRNARVSLTDSAGVTRTVISNAFGNYHFEELEAGASYIIGATAKGRQFSSQFVNAGNDVNSFDLIADSTK